MIKFFRHIRQSLIMENKSSRYFKYAIGEIILVVVGILLALQINNWNEERKASALEKEFLQNIQQDLDAQLLEINLQIKAENEYLKAASELLNNYSQENSLVIDSLFYKQLFHLTSRRTFKIYDPTYTELLSSGQIVLIKSRKLKNSIVEYYQELTRTEKIIQNNNIYLTDQNFIPVALKLGNYYESDERQLDTSDIDPEILNATTIYNERLGNISKDLLSNPKHELQLINALKMRHGASVSLLVKSKGLKKSTEQLKNQLSNYNY